MRLVSISDIAKDNNNLAYIEFLGSRLGVMDMTQVYLLSSAAKERASPIVLTPENALEVAREKFSLAIMNVAFACHEIFEIHLTDTGQVINFKRPFMEDEHILKCDELFKETISVCAQFRDLFLPYSPEDA